MKFWKLIKMNNTEPAFSGYEEDEMTSDNPNYHVIKKSDVDGDVMEALDKVSHYLGYTSWNVSEDKYKDCFIALKTIRNALIAQSDPDMVTIPRKVLEGMINPDAVCLTVYSGGYQDGYHKAINDVLNYKEGE